MVPPTLSRRERKKQETKTNILRTARHLFRDKGIDNVSIEEITEEVDVSRGTFFNYFPNKDGLIIGIAEEEVEELIDYIEGELAETSSAVEKLRIFYAKIIEDAIRYLHITKRVIVSTILTSEEEAFCIFKEYSLITERLVLEAQKKKELTDRLEANQLASMLIGCYYSVLHECIYKKDIVGATAKLNDLMNGLFTGIAGEKCPKIK